MAKGPQNLGKGEEESLSDYVNPFDESIEEESEQAKVEDQKIKRIKKHKKSKKSKKSKKDKKKQKKTREYDDEDYEDEINSMFDQEAESGDEEDEMDEEAEIGYEQEREKFQELYKRPNATQRLMERLEGKNQREINAQYSKKAYISRQQQQLYPSQHDPKIFVLTVKPRSEQELVLCIMNKARCEENTQKKVSIISVFAMKKRYPGKLFVEAFTEDEVYSSLNNFNNIYWGKKILKLENEAYASLFTKVVQEKHQHKQGTYLRVKKGLYEGDLAKIFKVKKNTIDVLLVPRINLNEIAMKIKDSTANITDQELLKAKKEQILKLFIDHKSNNFRQRPAKRQLLDQDFAIVQDIPGIKNIRLASQNGLIILTYSPRQLQRVHGTYLPAQVIPFSSEGNFMEEIRQEASNMVTAVKFKTGEEVEVITGELTGHYGTLLQIRDNIGIIKCKSKELKGQNLSQPLQNLAKRFRQGDRVRVTSGGDVGKIGIILTVQAKTVQIWTDNSNSIKVNKKWLQRTAGETICSQNVHNLKKDNLIKTSKGVIGIVIETTKDNIKIMDTNNSMQVVSNMDFDQKIDMPNLVAKNKHGDEIKAGSLVVVRAGASQGKKCRVVHVYRQHVFLFNQCFKKSCGVNVQIADNCTLVSKNNNGRVSLSTKTPGARDEQFDQGEQITVGMTITLKSGPLKGYKGVVKSINKQKIEVRVLSKSCTEWIPRASFAPSSNQEGGFHASSTPNRLHASVRLYEQGSPTGFD